MTFFSSPQEQSRFFRFAVVGIIGAIVDFGTFNILVVLAHVPFLLASVISFAAAVVSNFLWNRFWTYPDSRSKKVSRQIFQFVIISLVGLTIRTPLLYWLEQVLIDNLVLIVPENFFLSARFIGHNVALAIAVLVVMMWNFFANRFWTYNDVE